MTIVFNLIIIIMEKNYSESMLQHKTKKEVIDLFQQLQTENESALKQLTDASEEKYAQRNQCRFYKVCTFILLIVLILTLL